VITIALCACAPQKFKQPSIPSHSHGVAHPLFGNRSLVQQNKTHAARAKNGFAANAEQMLFFSCFDLLLCRGLDLLPQVFRRGKNKGATTFAIQGRV
jgi:hypothetical protein